MAGLWRLKGLVLEAIRPEGFQIDACIAAGNEITDDFTGSGSKGQPQVLMTKGKPAISHTCL